VAPGRTAAARDASSERAVRTALSAEARDGFLNVFMPPVASAENYLELVAAIEDVAAELRAPVRIEGYPPPPHPELNRMQITPDPGVIEVNVHPARSWAELREITETLYEEARAARLSAEKFLIDGRAVGTGGGNQIVVGAAHPLDSAFLRRPDVLGSLLRYWQNHPSLSYLFSGSSSGRRRSTRGWTRRATVSSTSWTSPSPRSRRESGGAALAGRPHPAEPPGDVAGNTHRTEFCIDKLYAPESATAGSDSSSSAASRCRRTRA